MKRITRLLLSLPLLLCCSCVGTTVRPDPIPFERIVPAHRETYTGLASPERLVIHDAAMFEAVWTRAFHGDEPVPSIDFDEWMVIVVAMGERGSGGFSIRVSDVSLGADGIDVSVDLNSPGRGCAVTLALTQPVDVVKVPIPHSMVAFHDRTRRSKTCS